MAHAIDGSIDLMAKIEPHRTRGVAQSKPSEMRGFALPGGSALTETYSRALHIDPGLQSSRRMIARLEAVAQPH